jgi:hypothetical protein
MNKIEPKFDLSILSSMMYFRIRIIEELYLMLTSEHGQSIRTFIQDRVLNNTEPDKMSFLQHFLRPLFLFVGGLKQHSLLEIKIYNKRPLRSLLHISFISPLGELVGTISLDLEDVLKRKNLLVREAVLDFQNSIPREN